MSDKWTDKLRGVSFSKFTKVIIKGCSFEDDFDTHMERYPPGLLFSNEKNLSKAFDMAAVYHGLYMTPDCSAPCDYASFSQSGWEGSYLVGLMRLEMLDDTGKPYSRHLPVLFSSSSVWKPSDQPNKTGLVTGVKGLFAGLCMVVSCSDNPSDTKSTNLHEVVHAMVASLPDLRQTMYGDDEWTKAEETVVHLVTDKASIVGSLSDMVFKQSSKTYTGETGRGKDKQFAGTMIVYSIDDILVKGESIVNNTIEVDGSDPDILNAVASYKKMKEGYFLL